MVMLDGVDEWPDVPGVHRGILHSGEDVNLSTRVAVQKSDIYTFLLQYLASQRNEFRI